MVGETKAMPVPKGKQKLYGKIVGHLQNLGIGREAAKDKADSAVSTRGEATSAVAKTTKRKPMKSKGRKHASASRAGY
jgi:hypothetical protein